MDLDVKTLIWVNIVVAFAIAAVTFPFWSNQPAVRGLRGWSAGLILCGFGWLALVLRGSPPSPLMTIIPSAFVAAGFLVVWLSIRRFNDTSFSPRHVALSLLLFVAVFTAAWLSGAHTRDRVILVSLIGGVLTLLTSRELLKGSKGERLRGRWPTAVAFAVLGLTMIARAGLSLHAAWIAQPDSEDPTRGAALFIVTICLVAVTLGLLMMSNERLRNRYATLALTDELTDLPNRRFFLEQGERLSRRAFRDGAPACLLMMDLDHFSTVNERFGHAGGDEALVEFGNLLRRLVRPTDLVSRYGGEEFAAVLVGASLQEAAKAAERIRVALAERAIQVPGQTIKITVSIGVASLQNGDLRATIRMADEALYQAKSRGRNQVASAADSGPLPNTTTQRRASS
jgi:diguanylate cyclase (GGDEF)-like protein